MATEQNIVPSAGGAGPIRPARSGVAIVAVILFSLLLAFGTLMMLADFAAVSGTTRVLSERRVHGVMSAAAAAVFGLGVLLVGPPEHVSRSRASGTPGRWRLPFSRLIRGVVVLVVVYPGIIMIAMGVLRASIVRIPLTGPPAAVHQLMQAHARDGGPVCVRKDGNGQAFLLIDAGRIDAARLELSDSGLLLKLPEPAR